MSYHLFIFLLIPFIGFIVSLLIAKKRENFISAVAFLTAGSHFVYASIFVLTWLFYGHPTLNEKDISLLKTTDYEFFIDLYFDKITATYLMVGSFLTFLVTIYSRYYLHREVGYKRFFNTILFFYLGYNIAIFAGNLETLFLGWEILGICSFLLIAFYRERYLPSKNAIKVFSVYRIGDVGLILTMWMSHHLWHENITFLKLSNYQLVHQHLQSHSWIGVFISLMILIAAAAKSAQLPFSSWLPRAMEGPTPSSAIFYGSLSVHLGVFLLLRTYVLWEHQFSVRIIIALLGLLTSFVAISIARVQSSIKSQIGYASVGQIGLIFVEVACGFEKIALIHFAGNAFLRTYQLLVSPSVVSYLIREQFYNFTPRVRSIETVWSKKFQYTLYILCLKEWNLDAFMYRFVWNPLKNIGRVLRFVSANQLMYFFVPTYLVGLFAVYHRDIVPPTLRHILPIIFSLIGLMMVIKSFAERKDIIQAWFLAIMNHFWVALAISFNEKFSFSEVHLYLSGVFVAGIVGYLILRKMKTLEIYIDIDQFHGHAYKHPNYAFVFLMCSLGVSGFPISPTFIGEDLIFSHIHENQFALALFTALSFVIDGLSIIRIFGRVFMGPHVNSPHEMAHKSA